MAASEPLGVLRRQLLRGLVIPAHPLALTASRRLDERRQVALTRYYCEAGAGGVAVGVHTTQFAIRRPDVSLLAPVLQLAVDTVRRHDASSGPPVVCVAGVCGHTDQAMQEAELAASLGYDAALLSLASFTGAPNSSVLDHCRRIADVIPLVGFYLQPAVGGRLLDFAFWQEFFGIDRVVAVKVAPFNRYQTLDVVRALAASGRSAEIALYTGNDDAIVADLVTPFAVGRGREVVRFAGGLLGQWAVGTHRAVDLLRRVQSVTSGDGGRVPAMLLAEGTQITDLNAALFDVRHQFAGCIAGIHEVLRRQGLLDGRWCLDPEEDLSPGQMEELDRVLAAYPHLTDDEFVAAHRDRWLA